MKLLEVIAVSLVASVTVTAFFSLAVLGFARRVRVLGAAALVAFFAIVVVGVDVMLSKG